MRIGIYSGTFDPVHAGHVGFAEVAMQAAGLDSVLFMPEPKPRGKIDVTDVALRTQQLQKALEPFAAMSIGKLADETFSVNQTLPQLQALYPEGELWLLIGSDVARSLGTWPDIERLSRDVGFIVGVRQGDSVAGMQATLSPLAVRYVCIDSPYPAASSSQLRRSTSRDAPDYNRIRK